MSQPDLSGAIETWAVADAKGDPFERRRLRVYVAGPISKGDVLDNIVRAIKWGRRMVHDGLAPYIPHFDAFMFAWGDGTGMNTEEISWNEYLEWDLEWVASSEAVFRVAGESKGADLETRIARELGIPVYGEDGYGLDGYEGLLALAETYGLAGVQGQSKSEARRLAIQRGQA